MSSVGTLANTIGGITSANPLTGLASGAANTVAGFGLRAIGSWVLDGTKTALQEVASAIGAATTPNLESTWFSATYWRVAALAAMLTVPFLFAAAVQALARSDLALLAKATFGYLPLALLGVSLAAPLTMLLLSATDQMSAAVAATGTGGGARFLDEAASAAGAISLSSGSPFFAVTVGLLAVMAALALMLELLVRAAAVYVVVLMLPLAFAALVWPARRIWAARLVELLASLILSKFVIVAVLSLAGAAFSSGTPGISQLLTAMALLMLSTFAPWTLMRILPFTELAAGAAGMLRNELPHSGDRAMALAPIAPDVSDAAMSLTARMRSQVSGDQSHEGFPTTTTGYATSVKAHGPADAVVPDHSASPPQAAASPPDGASPPEIVPSAGDASTVNGDQPPNVGSTPIDPTPPARAADQTSDHTEPPGGGFDERPPLHLPPIWRTVAESNGEVPEIPIGPELLREPYVTGDYPDDAGEESHER